MNNQRDQVMFNQLLNSAAEIEENSLMPSSRRMYDSCIRTYLTTMMEFSTVTAPFPITEPKMRVFIEFCRTVRKRTYKTLLNYCASFTFYFVDHGLQDLTKTISFQKYRQGLSKQMRANKVPNRKEPIDHNILNLLYIQCELSQLIELSFITAISVMFFGSFEHANILS